MSFKYINPGYSKLLERHNSSTTYPTQILDTQYSKTGAAWLNGDRYVKFPIPSSDNSELWAKYDVLIGSNTPDSIYFGNYNSGGSYDTFLYIDFYNDAIKYYYNRTYNLVTSWSLPSDVGLRTNALNTIWIHFKLSTNSEGFFETKINNVLLPKHSNISTGALSTITSLNNFVVFASGVSSSKKVYFSNIIISDEEISPNERVVLLPVSSTVTDMESLTSGLYVADTASETLLQSVNTASLIQEYGSDSKITGIALIGNPAYEVDDVIGSLTSLSKKNNTVTEHDTLALSVDTDAMILSSFSMPTDTTVADLSNIQFGWRAEE